MNKTLVIGVIIAAALAGFVGAHSARWFSPGWGPGSARGFGPGMMWAQGPDADDYAGYGYGMHNRIAGRGFGPGMMQGYGGGPGYGPGMMQGRGWSDDTGEDLNLTIDQVKRRFERRLAIAGNERVKLGTVAEKDAKTITVDILTTDKDGLVQRFSVDRHTGATRPVDD